MVFFSITQLHRLNTKNSYHSDHIYRLMLTLFRMSLFGAAHGCRGGGGRGVGSEKAHLPIICHTYPTMMKLGSYTLPKKDPKNIWITWHTHWVLLTSAFFHRESANFVISRNTDIVMLHKVRVRQPVYHIATKI